MTDLKIEQRTDSYLLRLIARDHERLAPNAYHSAETLRDIANRLEALRPTVGAGDGEPVAWLVEHDKYDSEIDGGSAPRLTDADKAAGWRETPLYPRPQPSEPTPAIAGEVTDDLRLLVADCRQALFDAIKNDEGASNGTRYEIGRAIGLFSRVSEALASKSPPAPDRGLKGTQ